jgi:hypothetical protein
VRIARDCKIYAFSVMVAALGRGESLCEVMTLTSAAMALDCLTNNTVPKVLPSVRGPLEELSFLNANVAGDALVNVTEEQVCTLISEVLGRRGRRPRSFALSRRGCRRSCQ